MDDPMHLEATRFLDYGHPAVAAFVRDAVAGAADDVERAKRLFVAVRDRVRYDPYAIDLAPEGLTASATLLRGRAFCVPKANLLAASLRSVGIPAQLGFADVTNHLATQRLRDALKTDVFAFHGYVVVHLGERTVKLTPAFDSRLCAFFGVAPLEFDGVNDAMLQPFDSRGRAFLEYLTDRGVWDDFPFDEMIRVWREIYPHIMGGSSPKGTTGSKTT
jgi:transglutaminase-like putative cysteine protease